MLHRNINIRGQLPFGRNFRVLQEFLSSGVQVLPFPLSSNPDSPIAADVEFYEVDPLKAEIRIKSKAMIEITPGSDAGVVVMPDNSTLVRHPSTGAEVKFYLPTR
jgi:hypothetical protein